MASTGNAGDGDGNQGNGGKRRRCGSGKYTLFSNVQVEILEKEFAENQNPTRRDKQQMVRDRPQLKDLNVEQIEVWFHDRRCTENLRSENVELQAKIQKLSANTKLLTEENDMLQEKVMRLVHENGILRNQLQDVASPSTELNSEFAANSPQLSISSDDIDTGLILLAEETREEFLLKATGQEIEWIPISGIKPSSISTCHVYVCHDCTGVAARACASIPLVPVKIMEILKERASWSWNCRNIEVLAKLPDRNGGTIELIYVQFYAPTSLATARDFWTLRYTSTLEDGSLVVCEKSLSSSSVPISEPNSLDFERAKMLASGYLIRPCESGGSIIHIVDHMDLEASSVNNILQPLYKSSELLAQKITVAAIGHIQLISKEMSGNRPHGYYVKNPATFRSFSLRLSRAFNDAINTFTEDGWSVMDDGASEGLVLSTKPTRNLGLRSVYDGILCVKAYVLLQDVSPPTLVRLLRDHRSDWACIKSDARSAASIRAGASGFLGSRPLSGGAVLIGHTIDEDEILEAIQVDNQAVDWKHYFSDSVSIVQICNGLEDNSIGACSELIFAPCDGKLPDHATLLSSGFRVLSLGSKTCNRSANWSKNLSTRLNKDAVIKDSDTDSSVSNYSFSVLVSCFQFPNKINQQEHLVAMVKHYMRHVNNTVCKLARATSYLKPEWRFNLLSDSSKVHIGYKIYQSYRYTFGFEFLQQCPWRNDSLLEQLYDHQDAILCWSFLGLLNPTSYCVYINYEGLNMLEATLMDFGDISLNKIVNESGEAALHSVVPIVLEQGYAFLPAGICLSKTGRYVKYDQAVAWFVPSQEGWMPYIAFAFLNWAFV